MIAAVGAAAMLGTSAVVALDASAAPSDRVIVGRSQLRPAPLDLTGKIRSKAFPSQCVYSDGYMYFLRNCPTTASPTEVRNDERMLFRFESTGWFGFRLINEADMVGRNVRAGLPRDAPNSCMEGVNLPVPTICDPQSPAQLWFVDGDTIFTVAPDGGYRYLTVIGEPGGLEINSTVSAPTDRARFEFAL